MTWIERTAYPRLSQQFSMRELVGAFTPTVDEIAWARAQTRSDQHLLTLLVLLKCHQRLGYFPRLAAVPVVERVREVTGLPQSVVAEYRAARSGKRLRSKVRARLGVMWQSAAVRAVAEAAMREASLSKDNPADVINMALEALARALRAARLFNVGRDRRRGTHRGQRQVPSSGR